MRLKDTLQRYIFRRLAVGILLGSGLALTGVSAVASWLQLGATQWGTTYIDQSSIEKSGAIAKIRYLVDLDKQPIVPGKKNRYASAINIAEYDCAQRRSRILHITEYAEPMGAGKTLISLNTTLDWDAITPNSVAEKIWTAACFSDSSKSTASPSDTSAAQAHDIALRQFEEGITAGKLSLQRMDPLEVSNHPGLGGWLVMEREEIVVIYDVLKTDSLISPLRGTVTLKYRLNSRSFESAQPPEGYRPKEDSKAEVSINKETLNFSYTRGAWAFSDGLFESVAAPGTRYDSGPYRTPITTTQLNAENSGVSGHFARALLSATSRCCLRN